MRACSYTLRWRNFKKYRRRLADFPTRLLSVLAYTVLLPQPRPVLAQPFHHPNGARLRCYAVFRPTDALRRSCLVDKRGLPAVVGLFKRLPLRDMPASTALSNKRLYARHTFFLMPLRILPRWLGLRLGDRLTQLHIYLRVLQIPRMHHIAGGLN